MPVSESSSFCISLLSDWGNTCSWNSISLSINISKGKWGNRAVFFTVKYLTSLHMLNEEIFSSKIFFTFLYTVVIQISHENFGASQVRFYKEISYCKLYTLHLCCTFFFLQSVLATCLATPAWWENSFEHLPHLYLLSTIFFFFCITGWGYFHVARCLITRISRENVSQHPTFLQLFFLFMLL